MAKVVVMMMRKVMITEKNKNTPHHAHHHGHHHALSENKKDILFGIFLNGTFSILEIIFGILSNSLALMSDAVHDFGDTFALLLSYWAVVKATKKPNAKRTWGYHRATILTAFINALVLIVLTSFIFYRALLRLFDPEPVNSNMMMGLAVLGVIFNGTITLRLFKKKDIDLNIKSIFWHIMEDALGWIGVLVAGILIRLTGYTIFDPAVSIIIGVIVLKGAWSVLKEAIDVLLESVPADVDSDMVARELIKIDKVKSVHDLHIWTIGSSYYAASLHAVINDMKICKTTPILKDIQKKLKEHNIKHVTIAFESTGCGYENYH